jgi:hypothetical protein
MRTQNLVLKAVLFHQIFFPYEGMLVITDNFGTQLHLVKCSLYHMITSTAQSEPGPMCLLLVQSAKPSPKGSGYRKKAHKVFHLTRIYQSHR